MYSGHNCRIKTQLIAALINSNRIDEVVNLHLGDAAHNWPRYATMFWRVSDHIHDASHNH